MGCLRGEGQVRQPHRSRVSCRLPAGEPAGRAHAPGGPGLKETSGVQAAAEGRRVPLCAPWCLRAGVMWRPGAVCPRGRAGSVLRFPM